MRGSRFGNGLGIGFRAGFEVTLGPKCKARFVAVHGQVFGA